STARFALASAVCTSSSYAFFFFRAEDGIRDATVTGVQTCALPISFFARLAFDCVGIDERRHCHDSYFRQYVGRDHEAGQNWSCQDRKSTRLNSSHGSISYAVFCLKKKSNRTRPHKTRRDGLPEHRL